MGQGPYTELHYWGVTLNLASTNETVAAPHTNRTNNIVLNIKTLCFEFLQLFRIFPFLTKSVK